MRIGVGTPAAFSGLQVGLLRASAIGAIRPAPSRPATPTPRSGETGLDPVNQLVQGIRDTVLERFALTRTSPSVASAVAQSYIDSALSEIGRLVGAPLRVGGVDRAVVSGLNQDQIAAYEVLALPPNANVTLSGLLLAGSSQGEPSGTVWGSMRRIVTANFNPNQVAGVNATQLPVGAAATVSGTVNNARTAAVLTYEGAPGGVVAGTASFHLTGPLGTANLAITAGESLSGVAQRINEQAATTGVLAEVQGDSLKLTTLAKGAAATLVVDNVDPASIISVLGVNGSQVDDLQVVSISDNTEINLSGTVTQAASRAVLTYRGGDGGVVVDSATFTLSGDLGNASVSIVQGESLGDVADRINELAGTTGVVAVASGDDLVLSSVVIGSQADLSVALDEITQYLNVSGVNSSQITNFQVVSAQPDSVSTLAGSVTQLADTAKLTYTGVFGRASSNATFTLSGSLGSANISVSAFETLTAVRNRINAQSGATGVTSSVSGNNLLLSSTGVGTAATVAVAVNSGTFNVTGGNGNGTANGVDARLTINGQLVVAAGNNVAFADALGSYSFSLVSGFTGAYNSITVTSANGTFDVAGGDGEGTAIGADAQATINGQALVASANTLAFAVGGGQFVLEIAEGFTGALDPITITSTPSEFTIAGGDENGLARGADASATLNGQTVTSADGRFTVSTPNGNLTVNVLEAFVGALDPFNVTVGRQSMRGRGSNSRSAGRDAIAMINGQTLRQRQGRFLFDQNGVEVSLRFAVGFQGEFDPFTISSAGDNEPSGPPLTDSQNEQIRKLIEPLFSLTSGRISTGVLRELATLGVGRHSASGALFDRVV